MTNEVERIARRFTHVGYVTGVDARSPKGYKRKVQLRETKTLWISKDNMRYNAQVSGGRRPSE